MESWELWHKRIVAYSVLETLKDVIGQLDECSDEIKGSVCIAKTCDDTSIYILLSIIGILTIQMLEVFLIPKSRKETLVHFVEVLSITISLS